MPIFGMDYEITQVLRLWRGDRSSCESFTDTPSRSCGRDTPYKLSFPLPLESPYKIWLGLAKRFWRRSLKMVDGQQWLTVSLHVWNRLRLVKKGK